MGFMRILGVILFTIFAGALLCGALLVLARLGLDSLGASNATRSALSIVLTAGSFMFAGWAGWRLIGKRKAAANAANS